MSSLVGYGVSSESEAEEEPPRGAERTEEEQRTQQKPCNFLLGSGSASSESGSESEREEAEGPPVSVQSPSVLPVPPAAGSASKLPSPALGGFCVAADSSVFANPFKERAEQKLSVLQKHVPLTCHAQPTHIGGKRVCVAYRKDGRCRFGIRCKFAHDSDLQQNAAEPSVLDLNHGATHTPACRESAGEGGREDEEENRSSRKKHRVGVSDSLIPPKRALKQYAKQRNIISREDGV